MFEHPVRLHWKKTSFSFPNGYQLKIILNKKSSLISTFSLCPWILSGLDLCPMPVLQCLWVHVSTSPVVCWRPPFLDVHPPWCTSCYNLLTSSSTNFPEPWDEIWGRHQIRAVCSVLLILLRFCFQLLQEEVALMMTEKDMDLGL